MIYAPIFIPLKTCTESDVPVGIFAYFAFVVFVLFLLAFMMVIALDMLIDIDPRGHVSRIIAAGLLFSGVMSILFLLIGI